VSLGQNSETNNRECKNRELIIAKINKANFKISDYAYIIAKHII